MRLLFVLLLGALLAAGLWVFALRSSEADSGVLDAPVAAAPTAEPGSETMQSPGTGGGVAAAERETLAGDGPAQAEPDARPEPGAAPEAAYEDKYADLSLQDLNRASRTLYSQHRSSVQVLMEERHDAGQFQAFDYQYDASGTRLEASQVIPSPPPGELVIQQVFDNAEYAQWRLVELPRDEFPELYARFAEYQWVSEEVKRRGRE